MLLRLALVLPRRFAVQSFNPSVSLIPRIAGLGIPPFSALLSTNSFSRPLFSLWAWPGYLDGV